MSRQEQIREALRKFAAKHGPLQTILATVTSVDAAALTCAVDNDGTPMYDVQLRPVINGNESVTLFPTVGSYVLIARIEDDENWTVIQCDEIDRMRTVIGTMVFEMDGNKFKMVSGALSLHDILTDLVTEVIAIYAPKNVANLVAIKTKINQLFN